MSKSDEKAKNTPGQSYSFGTSNRSGGITIQDDSVLESRKKLVFIKRFKWLEVLAVEFR